VVDATSVVDVPATPAVMMTVEITLKGGHSTLYVGPS